MRASHRPGASTSAGVGRSSSSDHRRVSASSPVALDHALDEGAAPVDLVAADVEAEEPREGLLTFSLLDPVAVPGLRERGGRRRRAISAMRAVTWST